MQKEDMKLLHKLVQADRQAQEELGIENELTGEQPEMQLSDGQTANLSPLDIQDNLNSQQAGLENLPNGLPEMTTRSKYYTQEEFAKQFDDFLTFLKSPQTSADTFEALRAEGQGLAAAKIFEMAQKYKWLRFIIDRRSQIVHDAVILSIFAVTETNAIVYNWTGISIIEKGKIWLKGKVKKRVEQAKTSGRRGVWGFLARRGAEKQPKQDQSLETSTGLSTSNL